VNDHLSQLEDRFLVLLYKNTGIFPLYERMDFGKTELSLGKLIFWYAGKLDIGTKTLLRTLRSLEERGIIERDDRARKRSSLMRYVLTKKGRELAIQLMSRLEVARTKESECFIKVLTKTEGNEDTEQPLFAIKKGNILSIENVTIKKESTGGTEFVITCGDTLVVTIRKKQTMHEIFIKGLTYDTNSFEKAKRYALVILQQRSNSKRHQLSYKFVPLTPLSGDYLSRKPPLRQKTKKLLEEWKQHTIPF
jgi:DNA-binding PadR family transcriptional regulator